MKLPRATKKGNRSFYIEFLAMTLFPLIVSGIIMMIVCSRSIKTGVTQEAEDNLKNVSYIVRLAFDQKYPGEYKAALVGDKIRLFKGDADITDDTELLDKIESEGNLEISIFAMDTRMLTTLKDPNGERFIMSVASEKIVEDVYRNRNSVFSAAREHFRKPF